MNPSTLPAPGLTLVIPCHNEAECLPLLANEIKSVMESVEIDYVILMVDDGSTDNSADVLRRLCKEDGHICALRLSRNFGKEAALLAGLEHSGSEAVITLDADLQHPPELIPKMLEAWRNGALVVHGVKRDRNDGVARGLLAKGFYGFMSRHSGFDMHDSSDYKLLDRKIVCHLTEQFPERGRFFRGLSHWVGHRQEKLMFDVAPRSAGKSSWSKLQLTRYAIDNMTAYSALPLQLLPIMGGIMLFMSLLLGSEALISRLAGKAVSGFATLEITLLFIGSLIMIGLGIIGQYLAHIYHEIKRRPLYLLEDKIGFEDEKE